MQRRLDKSIAANKPDVSTLEAEIVKVIERETDLGLLQAYADKYPTATNATQAAARINAILSGQNDLEKIASLYSKHPQPSLRGKIEQRLETIVASCTNFAANSDTKNLPVATTCLTRATNLLNGHYDVIPEQQYRINVSDTDGSLMVNSVLQARKKAGYGPGSVVWQSKSSGDGKMSGFLSTGHTVKDGVEEIWLRSNDIDYELNAFGSEKITREQIAKQFKMGNRKVITEIYSVEGVHYRRSWTSGGENREDAKPETKNDGVQNDPADVLKRLEEGRKSELGSDNNLPKK